MYEYHLEHKPAGGRMVSVQERLNRMAEEGWEPFMMSGGDDLTIILRRPRRAGVPSVEAAPGPAPAVSDED
jgi:hypothetical protein